MTWIKLCGLRTRSDVEYAASLGVDAIGFVTATRSVRRVEVDDIARLGSGVDVDRYMVTEDELPESVLDAARRAEVTGVQPHGRWAREVASQALEAGLDVLFPMDLTAGTDPDDVPDGATAMYDAPVPGAGRRFDHALLTGVTREFVLAGGLTPDNVGDVLATIAPYGVDVSSGIEVGPGVKDTALMRAFVEAIR